MEKFGGVAVGALSTKGFEKLSLKNKKLAYYLSLAGLYGRDIIFAQNSEYNIMVKNTLEALYYKIKTRLKTDDTVSQCFLESVDKFVDYLKQFWFHQGIYHSQNNKLLSPEFSIEEYKALLEYAYRDNARERCYVVIKILFEDGYVPEYKIERSEGKDLVADSGVDFYRNLTVDEVNEYRESTYPKGENLPMFGLNSRLRKVGDKIIEDVASVDGMHSKCLEKMVLCLKDALDFTENENQYNSIKSLIKYYETGDPKYFDDHSLFWVDDNDSELYFINGFIEDYDDPLGVACTFESIVAFKDPELSKKADNIIKNVQWFEDNLPIEKRFKKIKAAGLSASSINVCSMAGQTSPTLPLGICLPNSEWIREKHGSKSVNLLNVHNGRESGSEEVFEEFFLEENQESVKKFSSKANSLHTDLHEITGHGSGRLLNGVKNDFLKECYSIIEECRADLVGLYFLPNKEILEFGIVDSDLSVFYDEFAKTGYLYYLTKSYFCQLNNVAKGENIAQTHMRNRYVITSWILENATNAEVEVVERNGKHYIQVNDLNGCKELFGQLLAEIQRIKSEGDYEAAKTLIAKYGTTPVAKYHEEVLKRYEQLDQPKQVGFYTPIISPVVKDFEVVDYTIENPLSFIEDQMYLSENYSFKQ